MSIEDFTKAMQLDPPQATAEPKEEEKFPKTTSIVSGGRRKFHTTHKDGMEVVEEYDVSSNKMVVRKWRKPTVLGRETSWIYEVGEEETKPFNPMWDNIAPSNNNPIFGRKDTFDKFQWRVRNCFWPKSVYSVEANAQTENITIRTSNKKYFKVFDIPELKQLKMKLDPDLMDWDHKNNTLIISYVKPKEWVRFEQQKEMQLHQMKQQKEPKEGDVSCPNQ